MGTEVSGLFQERGLQRVGSLESVYEGGSYLVDASQADREGKFLVYPHRGHHKLHHIGRILNFYGTHWRYAVDNQEWDAVRREDGDVDRALADAGEGRHPRRHPRYFFREHQIGEGGFWMFVPETPGWEYYQGVLVPRFRADMAEYRRMKRERREKGALASPPGAEA